MDKMYVLTDNGPPSSSFIVALILRLFAAE